MRQDLTTLRERRYRKRLKARLAEATSKLPPMPVHNPLRPTRSDEELQKIFDEINQRAGRIIEIDYELKRIDAELPVMREELEKLRHQRMLELYAIRALEKCR